MADGIKKVGIISALCVAASVTSAMADEPAFRIRSDFSAPLNADTGWAGDVNETVTVFADQPFRLRMEVIKGNLKDYGRYKLQARRNGGAWETVEAHDFPYPQSEVRYDFTGTDKDRLPQHWTLNAHEDADVWLTTPPWPLSDFSYEAGLRIPKEASEPIDFLFCYVDAENHFGAQLDPTGQISVYRTSNGDTVPLTGTRLSEALSGSFEVEISVEDAALAFEIDGDLVSLSTPFEATECAGRVGVQWPSNELGHPEIHLGDIVIETSPKSPRISIVSTDAYADGQPTEDILPGATGRFTEGRGVSLSGQARAIESDNKHSEYEWPLVIRRFADGAELNETGDVFEFRMTSGVGLPIRFPDASVVLRVPDQHLGGTFVESPGRIGPWQSSNGDLYFIMEPAESDNKFMMVKSEDGGLSWVEADGPGRPQTGDLEAVDARLVDGRIHILHQITESTFYHVFNTSDYAEASDQWALADELVATGEAISQSNAMALRKDGSIAAFFLTDNLHAATRTPSGIWSAPIPIIDDAEVIYAGPQVVLGSNDTVHLAYWSSAGEISYRQFRSDGTVTDAKVLAQGAGVTESDIGAVLPLAYDAKTDTVFIVFRLADGGLWEQRVSGNGDLKELTLVTTGPVITDAVDSQQAAADLLLPEGEPLVLFIDEDTRSIYSTRRSGSTWSKPVLRVTGIEGSWVRGAALTTDKGDGKVGLIFDAGSQGGAGMNKYTEFDPE